MTAQDKQTVTDFLHAIAKGQWPEELVTADMTAWTLTSGEMSRDKFAGGIKLLAAIFSGTLSYLIDDIVAEGDRVVVETRSEGTLINGEAFHNVHVFSFFLQDGRIRRVAEYMNPQVVQAQVVPQMQALMAQQGRDPAASRSEG